VDVFANGRALVVGAASTATCYPTPAWGSQTITSCTMYGPAGQNLGNMQFSYSSGDAPFNVEGSFNQPALGSAGLYAY